MAGTEEIQGAKEEPVIPGGIGPDTRTFHRRHKPWYKRREFRRVAFIVFVALLIIAFAVALLISGR